MKRLGENIRGQGTLEYTLLVTLAALIFWMAIKDTGVVSGVATAWNSVGRLASNLNSKNNPENDTGNGLSGSGGGTSGAGGIGSDKNGSAALDYSSGISSSGLTTGISGGGVLTGGFNSGAGGGVDRESGINGGGGGEIIPGGGKSSETGTTFSRGARSGAASGSSGVVTGLSVSSPTGESSANSAGAVERATNGSGGLAAGSPVTSSTGGSSLSKGGGVNTGSQGSAQGNSGVFVAGGGVGNGGGGNRSLASGNGGGLSSGPVGVESSVSVTGSGSSLAGGTRVGSSVSAPRAGLGNGGGRSGDANGGAASNDRRNAKPANSGNSTPRNPITQNGASGAWKGGYDSQGAQGQSSQSGLTRTSEEGKSLMGLASEQRKSFIWLGLALLLPILAFVPLLIWMVAKSSRKNDVLYQNLNANEILARIVK